MKPFYLFAPIRRVDDSERTVEGYAFVQEVVEGEGGLRLTRAAMERATPDYMQWGALREMHQPQAAGTTTEIQWDEQGAYIRTRIVDDNAWKKVVERVYKGFSVGVQGLVLRGKQVTACRWIEISLVDRPKDPGAVITAFRAADFDAGEAGEPCLPEDSDSLAGGEIDRSAMPRHDGENDAGQDDADDGLGAGRDAALVYDAAMTPGITDSEAARRSASRSETDAEHAPDETQPPSGAEGIAPEACLAESEITPAASPARQIGSDNADLTRRVAEESSMPPHDATDDSGPGQEMRQARPDDAGGDGAGGRPLPATETNRLAQANAHLLQRAEMAESELAAVRAQLGAATERVRILEAQPKPAKPVVRFPGALRRDFFANHTGGEEAGRIAELRAERAALLAGAPTLTAQAERSAAAQRLMSIDGELRMLSA